MTDRRTVQRLVPPLLMAVALAAGGPALSQEPPSSPDLPAAGAQTPRADGDKAPVEDAQTASPGPVPSNAGFMKPLGRLSSLLGSVHFLRTLCGDPTAGIWRQKMNELMDAQAPNDADRKILIASFNGGYRAFESTYRKCTPAARLAVSRYQKEGATLSREISARYGN